MRKTGRIACGLVAAGMLAGCFRAEPPVAMAAGPRITLPLAGVALPDLGRPDTAGPTRSNAELAEDFLELEFRLESGRALPVFTRFEAPITVGLRGPVPESAPADLAALLARFRQEAGLQIRRDDTAPMITVEFVPQAAIAAAYRDVACFVVPGVSGWQDYRQGPAQDWAALQTRSRAAVFVPADASPQEVRDCLHEEIAQALGPLNDLYRLTDSVFNDDNFHTVLTGFDMLMLRVHYAPELASGMDRGAVAAALPGILHRLNPAGDGPAAALPDSRPTPQAWVRLMAEALSDRGTPQKRRIAAEQALAVAEAQGWADARLAFTLFAQGRLAIGHDPLSATRALTRAGAIYQALPGGAMAAAHVDMQLTALSLAAGRPAQAAIFADRAIPVARRAQNAALLSMLMLMKAEALQTTGQPEAARALRLDSRSWARYGFGSEDVLAGQLETIAALVPPALYAASKDQPPSGQEETP